MALAIIWTNYLKYRATLRGFDLAKLEDIIRYSSERYIDTATGRYVVIGRHDRQLVMIPYEVDGNDVTPVTIHSTTRQQIVFRLGTRRLRHV